MKIVKLLLVGLFCLFSFTRAQAADIPTSLIVNAGGMEWAWVSPCSPVQPSCGNTLVMHDGWSLASSSDFLSSFSGLAALYAAFNSPTQLCASSYFNSGYGHCDAVNISDGHVYNIPVSWGDPGASYGEAFVVRAVSEPETLALFGLSILGMAVLRRRQQRG